MTYDRREGSGVAGRHVSMSPLKVALKGRRVEMAHECCGWTRTIEIVLRLHLHGTHTVFT
jgi:hypothetical protein